MSEQPADRLLPGGRWPVTDPKDRLDELGSMVGAQVVPGVLVDELYGLAVEYRRKTDRLRDLLGRLEWARDAYPGADGGSCPVCRGGNGHAPDCWLAAELHPERKEAPPPK